MTAILKRKLAEAQCDSARSEMTALRALRLSVARAGDDLFELALGVIGARQQRMLPDDMAGLLSDDDLLIVLDCPDGQVGAAALAPPVVTSLLQQQTMGVVSDRAPEARPFTDTDAAMCAPLLEGVLNRASDLAEAETDRTCFKGIRFGAKAEDMRSLHLGLRAKRYRVFWLTLDIALGKHQAAVVVALPDTGQDSTQRTPDPDAEAAHAGSSPLLDVPAELEAVLARLTLSVSALNALSVGDTLTIDRDGLDDTALMTGPDEVVARGRLGQIKGHRAVRLMSAQAIPCAATKGQDGAFDPSPAAGAPAPTSPDMGVAAPMGTDLNGSTFPGLDGDLDVDSLGALSPQEAAEQIGELAGLSVADLGGPEPAANLAAGLPALPGDALAGPGLPADDVPPMSAFPVAPPDLDEDGT